MKSYEVMRALKELQRLERERAEETRFQDRERAHRRYNPDEPEKDIMEWY